MSKIQTILSLFLVLVIIFSMNMIFDYPITETFRNKIGLPGGRNISIENNDLYKPSLKLSTKNGNIGYSSKGFIGSEQQSDDQPLYFGFSSV